MENDYLLSQSNVTLNWHFTQTCNMRCRYCFVPETSVLLNHDCYFILDKICKSGVFGRINFAGGEPATSPLLEDFLQITRSYNIKTSIVTNGFNLIQNDNDYCNRILSKIDSFGLSIDSLIPETNYTAGRSIYHNGVYKTIKASEYEDLCKKVKDAGIFLKLNTVVNKLNLNENFVSFYSKTQPERIKFLQILKPNNDTKHCYDDLLITEEEYQSFVKKHHSFSDKIISENNSDMTSSYYMLGSDGKFWDNLTGCQSPSLLDASVDQALKSVFIDSRKYEKRYARK